MDGNYSYSPLALTLLLLSAVTSSVESLEMHQAMGRRRDLGVLRCGGGAQEARALVLESLTYAHAKYLGS
jgi:hypothetical protein